MPKNFIFLPPALAAEMTNPEIVSLMSDNPNSVIIIEDAENIIINREVNEYSSVSSLLNIADVLIADVFNIQLICTFNTDIVNIDKALLRKGRLIAKYEFSELAIKKANNLSKQLGCKKEYVEPTKLAEIYNHADRDFNNQKCNSKLIGF